MKCFRLYMFCLLALCSGVPLKSQHFQNLDFEKKCEQGKTGACQWDLSWGGENSCLLDNTFASYSLRLQSDRDNAVVFVEQSTDCRAEAMQVVQLSARVKTDQVAGKGAGLNIGMYDADGRLLATKDMGGYYSVYWVTGTTNWHMISLSAVCPSQTRQIKIGLILYGKGKAWFDDYDVVFHPLNTRQPNQLSKDYIQAASDIIAKHSLLRDTIDIEALTHTALKIAGPANKPEDCHLAVQFMLESLRPYGDHHSFFMTPKEVNNWEGENKTDDASIAFSEYGIVDGCGYLKISGFHGGNDTAILSFADSLQKSIAWLEDRGIKGWVVDLRENTGGNMEPMIAGLGPLLDGGPLGALIDVEGRSESWSYINGSYYWENERQLTASDPVQLTQKRPIAVLTGPQTGSSGEIVAISFIGNSHTKSFGQPTWGLTTGNGDFDLPDGARMMLASTIMADRHGKPYYGPVPPAVAIEPQGKEKDEVMEAAIQWIKNSSAASRE